MLASWQGDGYGNGLSVGAFESADRCLSLSTWPCRPLDISLTPQYLCGQFQIKKVKKKKNAIEFVGDMFINLYIEMSAQVFE